jgi:hypothetical protein
LFCEGVADYAANSQILAVKYTTTTVMLF